MKTKLIIVALVTVFSLVLAEQPPRSSPEPNAKIMQKLTEIFVLRERMAMHHEKMLAAGRGSDDGLAELQLAEARIALAQERDQPNAVVTALESLVVAQEARLKRLTGLAPDRMAPGELDRAKIALLETQVRLLRAQK